MVSPPMNDGQEGFLRGRRWRLAEHPGAVLASAGGHLVVLTRETVIVLARYPSEPSCEQPGERGRSMEKSGEVETSDLVQIPTCNTPGGNAPGFLSQMQGLHP